jgi:ABC-type sugar transport system substrate-binding protein
LFLVVAALVAALALSACGGGDSSTSGGGETSEAETGSEAPSGGEEETSGETGGAEEGETTDVAADVEASLKATPTKYEGPTEPVKPPAKPLKVALIACDDALRGCVTPLEAAEEAVKKLGWTTTSYDGKSDPNVQNQAFLNAVASGAEAIIETSMNPNLIQQGLEAAKRAGVPVISASAGYSEPNPTLKFPGKISPIFDVSQDVPAEGEQVANWIIDQSGGSGGVLLVSDPAYTLPTVFIENTKKRLEEACSGCTVESIDISGTQLASTGPTQLVGKLKSNSDLEYVVAPYDPAAAAFVPALAQAGLTDIKMCSELGLQENVKFIREGQIQACDAAWDNRYMGYATVDQLLRYLAKQEPSKPLGENIPYVLLEESNLPEEGEDWTAEFPYVEKFLELWGVE